MFISYHLYILCEYASKPHDLTCYSNWHHNKSNSFDPIVFWFCFVLYVFFFVFFLGGWGGGGGGESTLFGHMMLVNADFLHICVFALG